MVHCVVINCRSNSSRSPKGEVTFHRFPVDPKLKAAWIRFINRLDWIPTHHSRICSLHFRKDDFETTKKNVRLRRGALPSIQKPELPPTAVKRRSYKKLKLIEEAAVRIHEIGPGRVVISKVDYYSGNEEDKFYQEFKQDGLENNSLPKTENPESDALVTDENNSRIKKLRLQLARSKCKLSAADRKVKLLEEQKKRLTERMISLVEDLKMENKLFNHVHEELAKASSFPLFNRMESKNLSPVMKKEYEEKLREFAVTLHYLSPKAYRYVRETFDDCLPHPKSISRWYRSVKVDLLTADELGDGLDSDQRIVIVDPVEVYGDPDDISLDLDSEESEVLQEDDDFIEDLNEEPCIEIEINEDLEEPQEISFIFD